MDVSSTPSSRSPVPNASRIDVVVTTEPIAGRARWARVAISAQLVATVVSLGAVWTDRSALIDLRDGFTLSQDRIDSIDRLAVVSWIASLLTLIVAAVFFLRWFSRAYRNVAQWTGTRHGVGWAVGSWFVPFLNLWRPFKIAEEIADGSSHRDDARTRRMVRVWWALLISSSLIDRVILSRDPRSIDALVMSANLELLSSGLWILAGVAATVIIRDVTADQEVRRRGAGQPVA